MTLNVSGGKTRYSGKEEAVLQTSWTKKNLSSLIPRSLLTYLLSIGPLEALGAGRVLPTARTSF